MIKQKKWLINLTQTIGFLCATSILLAACTSPNQNKLDLEKATWSEIEKAAHGQTINLMMWNGDPNINNYMTDYVKPQLKKRFDISLNITGGQGSSIVSVLMGELQAGKETSEIDMMWINGETFYQLRNIDALYGPFLAKLPNSQYLDLDNPFVKYDFQQSIDGYEVPWGNVQFAIIYDSVRTPHPPRTMQEIKSFVRENPGTFTFSSGFTGMTFLKSLLIALADEENLYGPFDEEKYERYSTKLWRYINDIKPDFWKNGETFPSDVASMHQMFVSGELALTMSNNDAEVDNKILQGFFPESSRAYVLESGTIQNSHYMGVPKHSGHKAAAMAAANFLISPEAQYQKIKPAVWGDGTVLDVNKLPENWQQKIKNVPEREHAPPRSELNKKALRELAPEYMIRLYDDFRTYVVQE